MKLHGLLINVTNLQIFYIKCFKFLIALLLMSKIPIAEMSCQIYVVIYSINSLSVYSIHFRYIFRVSGILKYPLLHVQYFRVPANLANPIVMYFCVLKYMNNDIRYTIHETCIKLCCTNTYFTLCTMYANVRKCMYVQCSVHYCR